MAAQPKKKRQKAGSKMALTKQKLFIGDFVVEYAKTGRSCCRLCELPVLSMSHGVYE